MNFAHVLTPGSIASLVVAISFAAGLNLYATVLTLGVMQRMHWAALPSGLDLIADPWVMAASGALFAAEFFADKIPGLDLIWNAAHTFIRIPVAALLAYEASSHLSPGMQAVATIAGGAIASLAHGSKLATRVLVTPSPEPVSNIALSSAEDVGAVGLAWVATHHPYLGVGVVICLLLGAFACLGLLIHALAAAWTRLRCRTHFLTRWFAR